MGTGWTKGEFVNRALEEIGYASYIYDLMPEQLESVMRSLDGMIASWNAKQIRLGYPLPSGPNCSNQDDATNVPDGANEAIWTNLAIRIAPKFGKTISPDTRQVAKDAYSSLLILAAHPIEQGLPRDMPAGAGHKPWRRETPFLRGRRRVSEREYWGENDSPDDNTVYGVPGADGADYD